MEVSMDEFCGNVSPNGFVGFFPPQLTRDHSSVVSVLSGRNLRLKVAWTLWQRNVGELLMFFLRLLSARSYR